MSNQSSNLEDKCLEEFHTYVVEVMTKFHLATCQYRAGDKFAYRRVDIEIKRLNDELRAKLFEQFNEDGKKKMP